MSNTVNYIPQRDGDFDIWLQEFSAYLSANFGALGVDGSVATNIAAGQAAWADAYAAAIGGSTRGPATIATKNAARASVTVNVRLCAVTVNGNPAVTDEQRTALGITIRKTNKTPVPAPTTSPVLAFIAATPGQHTIRFADQLTPALRALPFGVIALELRVFVSITVPPPDAIATYVLTATKQPYAVDFANDEKLKTAYYKGFWRTRTGLLGPASTIISAAII